jgi:hypothetical protein
MRPLLPDGPDEKTQETLACPPKVYDPDRGRDKVIGNDKPDDKSKLRDDPVVTVTETGLTTPASTLCSTPYPEPAYLEKVSDGAVAAPDDMPSRKEPWWSRYSGYRPLKRLPPSRTRRALLLIGTVAACVLVAVLVWLAKTGRLGTQKVRDAASPGTSLGPPWIEIRGSASGER